MNENMYNKFNPMLGAPYAILTYLMENNEDLFKLLKYIGPENPYIKPNLTFAEKTAMISQNAYDTNESTTKNILFITELREAFSTNIAQLRVEVSDVKSLDAYRGFMYIDFQIIVPLVADVMVGTQYTGQRRTDSIANEIVKTLNGVNIPDSGFYSKMFIDASADGGAGRKDGIFRDRANRDYTARWVTFSVLV